MLGDILGFRYDVFDTGGSRILQELLASVQSKHQQGRVGGEVGDLPCSLKPVHDGHLQIQDHNVRVEFFDFFNSDLAIVCLAADMPVPVPLDASPDQSANDGVVIDDENCMGQGSPLYPRQAASPATSFRPTDGDETGLQSLYPLGLVRDNTAYTVRSQAFVGTIPHVQQFSGRKCKFQ